MRNGMILASIAFVVALAYIVGSRLSNEAIAVVVGAVCGIGASIPVSIALVIASSNNWGRREEPSQPNYGYDPRRYATQPQVLFVSAPQTQMPYGGYPQNPYYFPTPSPEVALEPREFKIIGGE